MPLGTGRRWWCGEQREDIHETGGMGDARKLARHILRTELVELDQISWLTRRQRGKEEAP